MKLFNLMDTAFNNFDASVRLYLAKTFNALGLQYTNNQIFGVVFNGIKGVMQNIMFYIEDAFTEQNTETAVRKKSVYSLAKISGYEPVYGYASTGTLLAKSILGTSETGSNKLYIENHTIVRNENSGISYVILLPTNNYVIDLSKPLITHEFKIVQGTFATSTYTAKGTNLETVSISNVGLWDRDYVKVYVDGEEYIQVSNLYDMTNNGKEYILSVGYDNIFEVMFGNNIFGKRLEQGQNVTIEYILHSGAIGNILTNEKSSFVFDTLGKDGIGNSIDLNNYVKLSMNNCVSGGVNSDSIDFVKQMIGYKSRSLVLASEDNYKLFLSRFSFVGHINCWSEENSMCVCVSCLSNKFNEFANPEEYFEIQNESDMLLTDSQKELIQQSLSSSNKTYAGVTMKFIDPIIRKFAIICYVKTTTAYAKTEIETEITKLLAKFFIDLPTNTQFISKSDIINKVVENISNIDSFDFCFISDLAEQTYRDGYYYKYVLKYNNGTFDYGRQKVLYESTTSPGLDAFGNINLDSKLEIPMILGNFKYYTEKSSNNKSSIISIQPIQFIFI